MRCEVLINDKCPNGHPQRWKCSSRQPGVCIRCERVRKAAERKAKEEFARQEKLEREQREYDDKLAQINAKITQERDNTRDA